MEGKVIFKKADNPLCAFVDSNADAIKATAEEYFNQACYTALGNIVSLAKTDLERGCHPEEWEALIRCLQILAYDREGKPRTAIESIEVGIGLERRFHHIISGEVIFGMIRRAWGVKP